MKVSLFAWKYEKKIKKNFLYLIAREEFFEMKYTYGLMEQLNGKGSRGEKVGGFDLVNQMFLR